jgi:hypothetical protein
MCGSSPLSWSGPQFRSCGSVHLLLRCASQTAYAGHGPQGSAGREMVAFEEPQIIDGLYLQRRKKQFNWMGQGQLLSRIAITQQSPVQ